MTEDPELINNPDRQIESVIYREGQEYAARNERSKEENKGRAESRANIKDIGVDTNAYATAIRLIKDKSPAELKQWKRDFDLVLKVMGSRQAELFPHEALKAQKREDDRKRKADEAKAAAKEAERQSREGSDTNRRSDPKSGGAGKPPAASKPRKAAAKKGGDNVVQMPGATEGLREVAKNSEAMVKEVAARISERSGPGDGSQADLKTPEQVQAEEQAAGGAALDAGLTETRSQSQIATDLREKAGLN